MCLAGILIKYARVLSLKDRNDIKITNLFSKILMNMDANQRKYGLIKAVSFIKSNWIHSWKVKYRNTFNAKWRKVSCWQKIYKYMATISKNVYIDKLGAIVKKIQQFIS